MAIKYLNIKLLKDNNTYYSLVYNITLNPQNKHSKT